MNISAEEWTPTPYMHNWFSFMGARVMQDVAGFSTSGTTVLRAELVEYEP
jgi:hypothetical protein